jgi:hypothetical protein
VVSRQRSGSSGRPRGLLVLAFADDIAAAAVVPTLLPERPFVESLTAELLTGWRGRAAAPGGAWLRSSRQETAAELQDHAGHLAAAGMRLGALMHPCWDAAPRASCGRFRRRRGPPSRLADGRRLAGSGDVVPPEHLAAYLGGWALLRDHGLQGITYGHFGEAASTCGWASGNRPGSGALGPSCPRRPGGCPRRLAVSEHGDGRAVALWTASSRRRAGYVPGLEDRLGPGNALNPGIAVDPLPLAQDCVVPARRL